MNRILLKLILILVPTSLIVPVYGQEISKDDIIKEVSIAASKIKSMECSFVQIKNMKMLGSKVVSKGKMYCTQPDKLRWEYTSPYSYIFILNSDKVAFKRGEHKEVIDVNSNRIFKEIASVMLNSVTGNSLTCSNFITEAVAEPKGYAITLTPLKKEMKMLFTKIVLHYNRGISMISEVELYEKNGDKTVISLSDVRKNGTIDDKIYNID